MSEQMSPPLPRGTWPAANPPMGWRKMQCKMQKTQHNAARSQWGVYAKPLVLQTQKYLANGTVVASIYGMKNETFTLENRKMENVIITPSYTDYEKYFNDMSDDLLTVWIEVAERRLPTYRRWDDIVSVKTGLLAAKSVQEKREKIQQGGLTRKKSLV